MMNTKLSLAALLILCTVSLAFAVNSEASDMAGGSQSVSAMVQENQHINADEMNAISNDIRVTPAAIVTKTESTNASGKIITVEVDGQTVTVTPSISTVVIRDGNVIVNTTEVHLQNGKMVVGETEVNVTPSQIMDKVKEHEKNMTEKRESQALKLEESNGKAVYAHYATEQRKLLGVFPMRATITEQYDAETGDFVKEVHPWWYFLSTQ